MFEEWSSCIVIGILLITIVMCIFACKHLWDGQEQNRMDLRYRVTEEHMKTYVKKCLETHAGGGGASTAAIVDL